MKQHFVQVSAGTMLHHEVDVLVIFVDLVKFDDIGVVHVLKNEQFFEEFFEFALDEGFPNGLDCNLDSGLLVDSDSDMAVGSTAYDFFFQNIVVVNYFFARLDLIVYGHPRLFNPVRGIRFFVRVFRLHTTHLF